MREHIIDDKVLNWTINTIPTHNNTVLNTVLKMKRWGKLPFPFSLYGNRKKNQLKKLLHQVQEVEFDYDFFILYGNISGGKLDLSNAYILDYAPIYFGDKVVIGRDVKLITSWHPLENFNEVKAKPIYIGDNVWLTMNIIVLPGVSIGKNTVIGAGSVVTHSIPENVLAAGNPARIIRSINKI